MGYVSFKIHLCFVSVLCYIYELFCHFYVSFWIFFSLLSFCYPLTIFCHIYVTFMWIFVTFMSHFWNHGTYIGTEYHDNYLILELDFDIVVKFGDRTSALRPTSTSELKWQVDRVKGDIAPLWEAKYHRHPQGFLPKDRRHTAFIHITNLQIVRGITGIGQKVGPRLRESCLLAPSGRRGGGRINAT